PITQAGTKNTVTLDQSGDNNTFEGIAGSSLQSGTKDSADVTQSGNGNIFSINQNGSKNAVTATQAGNGSEADATQNAAVSNSKISITQGNTTSPAGTYTHGNYASATQVSGDSSQTSITQQGELNNAMTTQSGSIVNGYANSISVNQFGTGNSAIGSS